MKENPYKPPRSDERRRSLLWSWRYWLAKARLLDSVSTNDGIRRTLQFKDLEDGPDRRALQPYEALSQVWSEYSAGSIPDYGPFISAVAGHRERELKSILDLACGTGTVTRRLAELSSDVVGIDLSQDMLVQAKAYSTALANVSFAQGDFRSLALDRVFDGAVCASNSINYLADISELEAVFESVAGHLHPNGIFVFDAFTESGMRLLDGLVMHWIAGDKKLAMRFYYDRESRREKVQVMLPAGIETHHRIPIEPYEVFDAADRVGLTVDDFFSHALVPGRWFVGPMCFYVLSKPR